MAVAIHQRSAGKQLPDGLAKTPVEPYLRLRFRISNPPLPKSAWL